ncbi:DUF6350 family protein [Nocardioides sp. CER19]|uniref:cell division protein PerM n=1 Tax=Nocardioides sp. CER19 TaxID=3038538 RepID=UPI00244C02B9|nr:DUF6350 family protein [Nocardioides sp. CER19]MDH2413652.1 DUF6350 family protein [Nocardioides sp. CER19]
MSSLLSPPARTSDQVSADLRHRRPLVVVATLGGIGAAAATLVVCLAVGVVGWFLTDAGAHGAPRDALRTGALAWLMAHGSGVHVSGTAVTVVPLGLTLVVGWALWRIGNRVGDSISGHGPDADRIGDGERDWTVPLATGLFTLGYVVTTIVTASVAGTAATAPSVPRATFWAILLSVAVGGTGIAVGSGRAAIAVAWLPPTIRAAATAARFTLLGWLAVSLVVLLGSLAVDFSTAANVMSQLHTGAGESVLYTLLTATVLPNATLFSGSYLLGPGFTVGVGTLVSPHAVVLGPMPMFPLLAALPDAGPAPAWAPWLVLLAPLAAALGAVRAQRRHPTTRWDEGAIRGLAGGVCAGLAFGILAGFAGGAVGPGRMADVAPYALDACVRAVLAFGAGGLLAGLAMTWRQRRSEHAQ